MELKLEQNVFVRCRQSRFNRTFMELKFLKSRKYLNCQESFNRTFMELKSYIGGSSSPVSMF